MKNDIALQWQFNEMDTETKMKLDYAELRNSTQFSIQLTFSQDISNHEKRFNICEHLQFKMSKTSMEKSMQKMNRKRW